MTTSAKQRDRKNRLAADGVHDQDLAPTLLRSSKATTFIPQPRQLEDFDEDDDNDDAISLASVSTMSSALATLRLPRLSELSPEGEPFECPICFVLQSFKKEKSWKSHAFRDLKAYPCTAGKECKDFLFSDRNSWFEHELHYRRFRRHVAAHLEQLAIFSMPRATEDNDIDGEQVSEADSRRSTIDAGQVSVVDWFEPELLATDDKDIALAQIIWSDNSSPPTLDLAFGAYVDTDFSDTAEGG